MRYYPTVRRVLLVAVIGFPLAQLVAYPALAVLSPRLALVGGELVLGLLIYLTVRPQGHGVEDVLLFNATSLTVLGATAVAAVGAALLLAEIDLATRWGLAELGWSPPLLIQRRLLEIQLVDGFGGAISTTGAIVIVPALCEEAFFRGLVLTSIAAHHGPRLAVVGSALLFALAHGNPWLALPLFVFGLFLGMLVYWTHSLYPAVLAHMVNNLTSLIGVNARAHAGVDLLGATHHVPTLVLVVALVFLYLGLRHVRRWHAWMPLVVPEN